MKHGWLKKWWQFREKAEKFLTHVTVRRWTKLFLFSAAGATCWFLVAVTMPYSSRLEATARWVCEGGWFFFAFGWVVFIVKRAPGRWHGFFGMKHFTTYPPWWVALCFWAFYFLLVMHGVDLWAKHKGLFDSSYNPLFAIAPQPSSETVIARFLSYDWFFKFGHDYNDSFFKTALLALVILSPILRGIVVSKYISKKAARSKRKRRRELETVKGRAKAAPTLPKSLEEFGAWVKDDRSVSAETDLLGHQQVAERMVERILGEHALGEKPKPAPTQMLVGPLGSGKSSTLNMVDEMLQAESELGDEVRLVRVEVSQFDSVSAATHGILQALVTEMGKHVNLDELQGLPDEYQRLVQREAPFFFLLFGGIRTRQNNPEGVFNKISEIAEAIGVRLVLAVEDLERFVDWTPNPNTELSSEQKERLRPILSMMHHLDQQPFISVLFTTTELGLEVDWSKTVRYYERLYPPSYLFVHEVLVKFRKALLEDLKANGLVDPAESRPKDLLPSKDGAHFQAVLSASAAYETLARSISSLRNLKTILRTVIDRWSSLRGEIDVDDLIILSVLEENKKDLFEVLSSYLDAEDGISSLSLQADIALNNEFEISGFHTRDVFEKRIEQVFEQYEDIEKNRWNDVFTFLFGSSDWKKDDLRTRNPKRIQSIRNGEDKNLTYWERFKTLRIPEEGLRDQDALQILSAWKNKHTTSEAWTEEEELKLERQLTLNAEKVAPLAHALLSEEELRQFLKDHPI